MFKCVQIEMILNCIFVVKCQCRISHATFYYNDNNYLKNTVIFFTVILYTVYILRYIYKGCFNGAPITHSMQ